MKYKVLVNKENKLKEKYLSKIELIETKDFKSNNIKIEKNTYNAYLKLQKFLAKKNITISISSAYRSIEEQEKIYNEYKEKYGTKSSMYVAEPKYSEHHTGLAIDLVIKINDIWITDNDDLLKEENELKKIHKYLAKYGFILRYPKGKELITNYSYEPWHIRYVGTVVSKIMSKENYTLEEYLNNYSGVIVVNKKAGMTSFDVVNEISKILGIKRIGHTGTLDPLAEGVLVVTLGKATKIAELLTATQKEYEAGVLLGVETDTLDISGKIVNSKIVPDNLEIEKTLNNFKKTYSQEVPIYSAVKVNGKKLYEYARENKQVNLPKKEVTIKEISLLETDRNTFTFKTLVSKGCYIRSLIRDIGIALNTYATMTSLTRTKQGKFTIKEANTLEDIKQGRFTLLKIEEVLDYQVIVVDNKLKSKIISGQKIKNDYLVKDKVIFTDEKHKLLGIYQVENEHLRVWKNFI